MRSASRVGASLIGALLATASLSLAQAAPEALARRPILGGTYVPSAYLDAVGKSGSPRLAWPKLTDGVSELRLASETDSIFIGWNNHEALPGRLEWAAIPAELAAKHGDLGDSAWVATSGDYAFAMRRLAASRRADSQATTPMVEVFGADGHWQLTRVSDKLDGLPQFVRARLVAGAYEVLDGAGNPEDQRIAFLSDGSLRGFDPFTRYEVWTDFLDDLPELDLMRVSGEGTESHWYAWQWSPDTLFLKELDLDKHPLNAESKVAYRRYCLTHSSPILLDLK